MTKAQSNQMLYYASWKVPTDVFVVVVVCEQFDQKHTDFVLLVNVACDEMCAVIQ